MPELELSRDERLRLKARSHHLNPAVLLGAAGLSEAVVKEIDRALKAHELIKVRVPSNDRQEREAIFATLADRLTAARIQMIGKLLVLYRPQPEDVMDNASKNAPAPRARPPSPKTNLPRPGRTNPQRDESRAGVRREAPRRSAGRGR